MISRVKMITNTVFHKFTARDTIAAFSCVADLTIEEDFKVTIDFDWKCIIYTFQITT